MKYVRLIGPFLVLVFSQAGSLANLMLTIDRAAEQVTWQNGSSISKGFGIDDNTFGSFNQYDSSLVLMFDPLLSYSGNGSYYGLGFDFSRDGTAIDGLGLFTTEPPGRSAMFSPPVGGSSTPTFSIGNFASFVGLNDGFYSFSPVSDWSGGIDIAVTATASKVTATTAKYSPVPDAGNTLLLSAIALLGFTLLHVIIKRRQIHQI